MWLIASYQQEGQRRWTQEEMGAIKFRSQERVQASCGTPGPGPRIIPQGHGPWAKWSPLTTNIVMVHQVTKHIWGHDCISPSSSALILQIKKQYQRVTLSGLELGSSGAAVISHGSRCPRWPETWLKSEWYVEDGVEVQKRHSASLDGEFTNKAQW